MLNKDICKRCINKNHYFHWVDADEIRWNNGKIYCPNKFVRTYTNGIPPDICPYKLEHIVNNNAE